MQLSAQHTLIRRSLFFIFTVSGVSGLIYELIWTHYLKLFLGHAAYAQTLVLIIFMGGIAIGAFIAGQIAPRIKRLFLAYIVVELLIGLMGFVFNSFFHWFLHISYDAVIPAIHSIALVNLYQWGLSSVIILPQSILLGMTFPFMSNAIIRRFPAMPGSVLAMLYFTNSFGAAIGVLLCGFMLIPAFGLPGAMMTGAILNCLVALATGLCTRATDDTLPHTSEKNTAFTEQSDHSQRALFRIFMSAAFFTGIASFLYEIGWVRLLTLVLGAATHSFELMLSSFILGLALGGLYIKRYIDRLQKPIYFLSITQIFKGLFALLSLLVYGLSFHVMQFFMHAITRSAAGYVLFNLSEYSLVILVMLPATFFAGMTLPLITHTLFIKKHDEKIIGQVYAYNTIGAIMGVYFAVHWVMPLFSLQAVIVAGALIDIILGIIIFTRSRTEKKIFAFTLSTISFFALIFFAFLFRLNPLQMASGVFRTGSSTAAGNIIFNKDGKTATVTVLEIGTNKKTKLLMIATNGKPDASITTTIEPANTESTTDESMQILLGALPSSVMPTAKTAAVIGFGSGMTSEALLQLPNIQRVDTIEIEKAMTQGAKHFLPYNRDVYDSPRSHLTIQDAKIFFAHAHQQYDLIVSEPSNPWVSGVASLFTDQFYAQITKHLTQHGVFCQWIQNYEVSWPLIVSMLKTYDRHFAHYSIYAANNGDILILGTQQQSIAIPNNFIFNIPRLKMLLKKVGINNPQDLYVRHIIDKRLFHDYLTQYPIPANSDYFPIVDTNAVKSRFLNQSVLELKSLGYFLPFNLFHSNYPQINGDKITVRADDYTRTELAKNAVRYRDALLHLKKTRDIRDSSVRWMIDQLNSTTPACVNPQNQRAWEDGLYSVGMITSLYLTSEQTKPLWAMIRKKACFNKASREARDWLLFTEATNARDISAMRSKANALLSSESEKNTADLPYLLGIAMIADLIQGDRKAAQLAFATYYPAAQRVFINNKKVANQFALSLKILAKMAGDLYV